MSDAYEITIKRTTAPLPQSLSGLRLQREEAQTCLDRGDPRSFNGERWSRRISEIDKVIDSARDLPLFSRSATEIPQPKVDAAYAQQLAGATESEILDYKIDLPFASKPPLVARSELLKDIMAIANTVRDQPGYLFYGRNPGKGLCSITAKVDDADVQQWAENAIEPPMLFSVHTVQFSGLEICLIVIRPASRRPHVSKATICKDGPLHEGQVWFRRGSKNTVATFDDLHRLFREENVGPIRFESTKDSGFRLLEDWFKSLRREVFHGRITQKDQLLAQGYEVARHPLNSCEILIGPDAMLFLKPFSDK